jgi:hypothetical protein
MPHMNRQDRSCAAPEAKLRAFETGVPGMVQACLRHADAHASAAQMLHLLIAAGLDRPPLPGRGQTLQRWRMLSAVAAHDLALAKLYEGHTDAVAIVAELGALAGADAKAGADAGAHAVTDADTRAGAVVMSEGQAWGTWCAEMPTARCRVSGAPASGAVVTLDGVKAWCSGAATVSHALVSAWDEDGRPWLVAVKMDQPGVRLGENAWCAPGMSDAGTLDVTFEGVRAQCVGAANAYLERAGFWHGGAGIGACWYGAAAAVGLALRESCARAKAAGKPDPHRMAHLGRVDCLLAATAELLRGAAATIDADPGADAARLAMRVRLAVEAAATAVLAETGEALGAGPMCRDRRLARLMADLPVFLRQSHGRRDQAALGEMLCEQVSRETGSVPQGWGL